MELWVIKNGSMTNITPIVGKVSWRSNVDELGDELNFNIAFNDTRYFPVNPCEVGNMIQLKGKEEIFRGILISENKQALKPIVYTSFDFAFYLNKSKGIYQFNEIPADAAIKKLLGDFNVPIGKVASMPTVIDKIYVNENISDITKDIMDQVENETGVKYLMEMRQGNFYIEERSSLVITTSIELAGNTHDGILTLKDASRNKSIENMKNSFQIVLDNEIVTTIKNDGLIEQYGLLQDLITTEKKDIQKAETKANNMLKDLGKVLEDNSVEMLGDEKVRAGRILEVNEPLTGMSGQYLIKSVNHSFGKGIHTMKLDLGVV